MAVTAFEIEAEVHINISAQTIDDIMCTALEGGITGWCCRAKVVGKYLGEYAHEQISRGGTLTLYDAESPDKWDLDLNGFLRGVRLWIEDGDGICALNEGEVDASFVDSEAADLIIQYALFGEPVFG